MSKVWFVTGSSRGLGDPAAAAQAPKWPGGMSQEASNKATFSRFRDAVNSGDMDLISKTIDEAVDPNLLFHAPVPNGMTGVQALKQVWVTLLHAFPDLHVAIEDVIAEGDKVVHRNTVTGTHQGEYRGVAPTGKPLPTKRSSSSASSTAESSRSGESSTSWRSWDNSASSPPDAYQAKETIMFLITGANGVVGRQVTNLLLREGAAVTAVTRATQPPDSVQVVSGDLFHPQWIEAALEGVEALQISPRATGPGLGELLKLAVKQGVKRVVLLSATTVEYPAGETRFANQFKAAEDLVTSSGLEWTVLRLADFAANALAWAPQVKAGDVVRGAYGQAATSPIHETDIAAVAVQALQSSLHKESVYTLTGPQSLDQFEKVRLIGAAIGRTLSFQEFAPEQVRQGMLAQGLPEEIPARLLGSLADYAVNPAPPPAR